MKVGATVYQKCRVIIGHLLEENPEIRVADGEVYFRELEIEIKRYGGNDVSKYLTEMIHSGILIKLSDTRFKITMEKVK